MTEQSTGLKDDRLLKLSNEVSRIANEMACMSFAPSPFIERGSRGLDANAPDVSAESVMAVIKARKLRARYFSGELFADPAWDMILHLFHAELTYRPVSVSSLSRAAAVPATTAIRWISILSDKGMLVRRDDPHDGRRVFIELTPETSDILRAYFAETHAIPAI